MGNVNTSTNLSAFPGGVQDDRLLPLCVWFTGLSGSGKTTLARGLERRLIDMGVLARVLDGDDLRVGLNRDLGFRAQDRKENVRRLGEVAKLFHDSGFIVLVSAISPFAEDRQAARSLFTAGRFIEVHVATPLEVCEARDPKGLYQRARRGDLPGFTGIESAYEPPRDCECVVPSERCTVDEGVQQVLDIIRQYGGSGYPGEGKGA
ncbi:adenylyl-sulfate kinase [Pseudomonas sp. CCOS 191]|uniref:adenylyl-sulfate kinase n=1 Tax=Pseudomonas sp. CCOS 191 TaxID=1649877 RepID=UPI0006244435|nr:adenylyl-sulfate kinase [Pseudomonas sp. CCOS 191]CRI58561.1 putative adenylyl-sulfate kinase [Pseudomonas sp. CCOS 191]